MTIGQWVRRTKLVVDMTPEAGGFVPLTRWHLVESVIDDEPVTRCGRRLRARAGTAFEAVDAMPLTRMIGQPQLCKDCQ